MNEEPKSLEFFLLFIANYIFTIYNKKYTAYKSNYKKKKKKENELNNEKIFWHTMVTCSPEIHSCVKRT